MSRGGWALTRAGRHADSADGWLYRCRIHHARPAGPAYRFSYAAYYLLLDIDRFHSLGRPLRWLSVNRFNLLSFRPSDHGDYGRRPLRVWVESLLETFNIDLAGGRVRLLCLPRVLGYVFNPLSVYYCEHADGGLRAIVCEVHNTFGEKHCYVLHRDGAAMAYDAPSYKAKCFHVSPLFERDGRYRFDLTRPGERMSVAIQLLPDDPQASRPLLRTSLAGTRLPLTDSNLLKLFLRIPLATLKIMAAIHWQALKIWWRGAGFVRKPDQVMPPRS